MTASVTAADLAVRGAGPAARRSASDGGSAFQSALDAQPATPHPDEGARPAPRPSPAPSRRDAAPDQRAVVEQRADRTSSARPGPAAHGTRRDHPADAGPAADAVAGVPVPPVPLLPPEVTAVPADAGASAPVSATATVPPAGQPAYPPIPGAPFVLPVTGAPGGAAGSVPAGSPAVAASATPLPAAAPGTVPVAAAPSAVAAAPAGQAPIAAAAPAAAVATGAAAPDVPAEPPTEPGRATTSGETAPRRRPAASMQTPTPTPTPAQPRTSGQASGQAASAATPSAVPPAAPPSATLPATPATPVAAAMAPIRVRHAAAAVPDEGDERPAAAPVTGQPAPVTTPALQQPVFQPLAPVAAAAPVAAPAAPADQPLAAQLVPPIAALASAGNGEHVVVVRVTPENLGTVTVRAHVTDGSMKVELFAAPHAQDAISAMLPDLRRDLAGSGPAQGTTVGLGTGDAPQGGSRGSGDGTPGWDRRREPSASPSDLPTRSPWRARPVAGRLDVLA